MDSSNNGASGGRWRPSTGSVGSSDERQNSLDREIEAELTVADGFRPNDSSSSPPQPQPSTPPQQSFLQLPPVSNNRSSSPSPSQASSSSARPLDTQSPSQTTSSPPIADLTSKNTTSGIRSRPSSISKVHRPHGSLTLRNDGSSGGARPRLGDNHLTPITSSAPTTSTDNGSSQYNSSAHPYQAYGQGSQTSTSGHTGDSHREGDYNGPRGPTHPYSLYPQTTAPMEDASTHEIPVGFTGMGATYSRQIGPDGEDAGDLIGSDGHIEELPPYTRYPDQAYLRRAPPSDTPAGSPPAGAPPQSDQTPPPEQTQLTGAGGLGIATRNPEFSATEEDLPASYATSHSAEMSASDITVITRDFAEKLPTGKWQRRARKKLFGVIPYWAICLLVLGLVLVGIVMGAVLGILLTDKDEKKPDGDESGATSEPRPSADVDFLPTLPSGLPPLATGLFDLPPLDTSQAPRLCFNDTTQAQSWSCEMPLRSYSMEVGLIQNASKVENYEIELEAINGSKKTLYVWGTQPPNVPDPVPLRLVNDTFEPARGPAWWREIVYDKTVIVSESRFAVNAKRGMDSRDWTYTGPKNGAFDPTRFMTGKPGPSNGETAWICTWPNVTMEIFIYPSQNSSLSFPDTPTATGTATDTPAPSQTAYDPTPAYPHVVKFLERRLYQDNDATAAFCRKVKVNDEGTDSDPVLDDDGEPIVVVVTEKLNSKEEVLEQSERSRHPDSQEDVNTIIRRETLELTDCGCLWWST